MPLLIPMAIGQALGGTLFMSDPKWPFFTASAGLMVVAVWAYLKVKDPRDIEK